MRIFPRIHRDRGKTRARGYTTAKPARTIGASNPLPALDFSQAVQRATSVDDLHQLLVGLVREAFSATEASLFIREEASGDFPCRCSTAISPAGTNSAMPALPKEAFVLRRLRRLSSPLQLETDELQSWDKALSDAPRSTFEARMREKAILQQTRSSLLIPLKTRNDLVGMLSLGERTRGAFSTEDREGLRGVAGQLALIVENTRLLERMVEHERLQAELALAAEVQRNLLPATVPELPGVELCGFCRPALQVGGDYYDFIPLPDGALICIADVAGKGIAAALMMSVVQASLRGQMLNGRSEVRVSEIVSNLNRLICGSISRARFVTCFCARINTIDGSLHFVNAGHNPPLLLAWGDNHKSLEFYKLEAGGPVLGLFPEAQFEDGVVHLQPGDILFASTDGVTEAMNSNEEEFSEERLSAVLADCGERSAQETLDVVAASIREWAKGAPQHDDMTIVVLKKT